MLRSTLNTARLVLRPSTPEDLPDFIALERDPEVMRFLNGGHAFDRAAGSEESTFFRPEGLEPDCWTAKRRDNGAFVGWFDLGFDDEQNPEIGYRLARAEWNQGFATEGARALVAHYFLNSNCVRIYALTMAINTGSRHVMEKLGMRFVGTYYPDWPNPFSGTELGEVEYEILRAEWPAG